MARIEKVVMRREQFDGIDQTDGEFLVDELIAERGRLLLRLGGDILATRLGGVQIPRFDGLAEVELSLGHGEADALFV